MAADSDSDVSAGPATPGRHRAADAVEDTKVDAPTSPAAGATSRYQAIEEELRDVQVKGDGLRTRMRATLDLFGLVAFGLAFAGLLVVATLATVSFVQDESGVGMLFAAMTIVALPLVGVAAWRAFGPLWMLSRELAVVRRREAELYAQLGGSAAAAAGVRTTRLPIRRSRSEPESGRPGRQPPPGNTATGWREPTGPAGTGFRRVAPSRGAVLWILVLGALILLMFVIGVAAGSATRS